MAFSSWSPALDTTRVRPSSVHLSHSGSGARSAAARDRECVASGTSRVAQRSRQGTGTSGLWFGCFVNLIRAYIPFDSQRVLDVRSRGGSMGWFPLLRSCPLSRTFHPIRIWVYCAATASALLPSLHE